MIKRVLLLILLLTALPAGGAYALDLEFSTIEVVADTGTYSIVFSDSTELGIPTLSPGDTLTLAGIGGLFDGAYYVTGTSHSVGSGIYTTRFTVRRSGMGFQSLTLVNYRYLYNLTESGTAMLASLELKPVPEPNTLVLVGGGLVCIGLIIQLGRWARRRGRRGDYA